MIKVVGVRFKSAGKVYYFDPDKFILDVNDSVIVQTARGLEFGTITLGNTEVKEESVIQPLKKVVRMATDEDKKRHAENERKRSRALEICQEKIDKHRLDMKLIDVEYTFDSSKIIFYFTADGRVDFRELVKDLASVFKMRIELRQIGVRDEAKMLSGIGPCGKKLCCSSWLSDFQPVSIKMAKIQNLSLNPTKISGICGRLMCCLKYENDVYLELRKGMPENGEKIKTRDGMGKVVETNILESKVKVRLYTGEKDDEGEEKLSSEITTYSKDEIKRLGQKRKNGSEKKKDILDEVEEKYLEEMKNLMKD